MRKIWLLLGITLPALGCPIDDGPVIASESGTDGESGTGATETGDGDGDAEPPKPTEPLCDGSRPCGSGHMNQGTEAPSSLLQCHLEVLRDADEPAWLGTSSNNPESSISSEHDFVIDGSSRWVTHTYSRYQKADGGPDVLLSRVTEICELAPVSYFEDCIGSAHISCWPSHWVLDGTCDVVDTCEE